jgi:secondary thiamine-phosphate synthase enzyme
MSVQRVIRLPARPRGFHLVTAEVLDALPELREISVGILHLLIQHTSASLALSENASPDVRRDFEVWFDRAVPERAPYWTHTLEGDDDMPAHVKAAQLGPSLTMPVSDGRPALGTWQGIYLCEHRDPPDSRICSMRALRCFRRVCNAGGSRRRARRPGAPAGPSGQCSTVGSARRGEMRPMCSLPFRLCSLLTPRAEPTPVKEGALEFASASIRTRFRPS